MPPVGLDGDVPARRERRRHVRAARQRGDAMKRTFAALVFGLASAGCSVDFSPGEVPTQLNGCQSDADCDEGSVCRGAQVGLANMCVSTSVDLEGLQLVVTPAAGSTSLSSASFVLDPSAT